jgi:hypothetical protein
MGGRQNVVVTVHWRLTGEDEHENKLGEQGAVTVSFDPEADFIPFERLTKDQVEGWVGAKLDVRGLTERIEAALLKKAPAPTLARMTPPWRP